MNTSDHQAAPQAYVTVQEEALTTCLAEINCQIVDFSFHDRAFFAIRLNDWVAQDVSDARTRALRDYVSGRLVFDGDVFVVFSEASSRSSVTEQSIVQRLTQRELMIAVLIAEGLTDKEIGRQLGISAYTVREHCRRACAKLNISKRSALVKLLFCARVPELT